VDALDADLPTIMSDPTPPTVPPIGTSRILDDGGPNPDGAGSGAERRWIGPLVRFLAHDPLPIGGIAASLVAGTSALLAVPLDVPLLAAAFCGTALVYGADRGLGLSPEDLVNRPDRVRWVRDHRPWLIGQAAALSAALVAATPFLQPGTLVLGASIGCGAVLYVAPVLPGGRRLKDYGVAKPIFVTAIWSTGSVVIPAVEAGVGGSEAPGLLLVASLVAYRVAFVAPNVFLADVGDRQGDRTAGRRGWGAGWRPPRVRRWATAVLGAAVVVVVAIGATVGIAPLLWIDAIGLLGMTAAVRTLRPGRSSVHLLGLDLVVAWPAVTALAAIAAHTPPG